ncbi:MULTISPECIES: YbfB/YjiJ family MFS transporter [Psychrobacter]|jgi:MFS family permease|uniref:YbfB/YjiJ family MFS transporter n=1 Tax=Psychrobacter TaxID=497 RepID=UPI00086B56F6|nr:MULTISPECIES: YbfB/YjiJ family MFS transporter [Psychrobacter]MBA6244853.1 YbfB/YjiJ family MFS transporter [Psychrobacter sp. Urea-trap-18]MBA6285985.1 YbfB/YjiJ family MFS transporter [Psychrobacter sp. Urea-trap-16]MBA6317101.1 YbfB/YjiJ family MFS transporter [Psychrobacter sp. Urea-trap-20]MBA6333132.1 YbfB/YjiJ family MFS transporter [Psychrobacter sp. Urea-trap-19]OEH68939.1 MAG: MFS transporter [Psychrobacter sp. B29-1]
MMTAFKSRMVPTITNEAAIACIGMYCMAVVMGYGRFLFTATLPDIMVQLSLSTTIAGWLASINYIGYFIGALIAMFVPQRSTWQAMTLWAIISVVTTMLLVIPNMSLTLWYIIRLIAGMASGVAMILSSSFVIQNLSSERRSVLSAVHYAGIGVGISASAIVTWWLLKLGYHFDVIWLVAGVTSLPVVWLLYAIKPRQVQAVDSQQIDAKQHVSVHQTYLNFKRSLYEAISGHHKALTLLFVSYVLAGFGYISSATFLPVMAAQRLTTQTYAGLMIWLVVGIFAMLSNPLWGALAKRIGEIKTLMGLTVLQAFGMCLPIWFDGAFGLYGNAAILGLTFVGMVSMTLTLFKNINPAYSNLLIALATLAYALGQFLGPLVTVALAGKDGNFNAGLLFAAIGLMIGFVLLVWFRRQSPKTAKLV